MGLILAVLLIALLFALLPRWPYSRSWGYAPSGIAGVALLVLIVLMLFAVVDPFVVPWTWDSPRAVRPVVP